MASPFRRWKASHLPWSVGMDGNIFAPSRTDGRMMIECCVLFPVDGQFAFSEANPKRPDRRPPPWEDSVLRCRDLDGQSYDPMLSCPVIHPKYFETGRPLPPPCAASRVLRQPSSPFLKCGCDSASRSSPVGCEWAFPLANDGGSRFDPNFPLIVIRPKPLTSLGRQLQPQDQ